MNRPRVVISMGDPGGIGPEVLVRALDDPALRARARFRVLGLERSWDLACRQTGVRPACRVVAQDAGGGFGTGDDIELCAYDGMYPEPAVFPAAEHAVAGAASFRFVEDGIAACLKGDADALVTGPINKRSWDLAGHGAYAGHTELLAERAGGGASGGGGGGGHAMMFHSPTLHVILATTHVALARVPGLLSVERVAKTIRLGHGGMRGAGIDQPRIAVCGLNPHAGEHGLMGDEDDRVIAPAVARCRAEGIDATGPYPADTIFGRAVAGGFDLVVAMYHDQGLIPLKLLARDEAVNRTVGLPFVRTSPDHGTAFDIAGRGVAHPGSMKAAIAWAIRLAALR